MVRLFWGWLLLFSLSRAETTTPSDDNAPPSCAADDATCTDSPEDAYSTQILAKVQAREFFINGTWTAPHSTDTLHVVDPSTARPFATIASGDAVDVDRAVQAAKAAQPAWSFETTREQRQAYLQRLVETYQAHAEEMAYLISREMGAPVDMARSSQVGAGSYHLGATLQIFEESFDFVRTLPNIDDEEEEATTTILMDPVGVVAAITPWNWPLNQIMLKIVPALLVGCTVVLKPSEITPLSALVLAEALRQADLPPGVFNLVNGAGAVTGHALASHPDVDMVSFTGSGRAGAQVSRAAADTWKRVALELGGKGAVLVFDDVGDEWAKQVLEGADFFNSGQSCNYASRWLVQRSLYSQAQTAAAAVAAQTRVDSAHVAGHNHIGPVANDVQYQRVQAYIQSALEQGATLLAGGLGRPEHLKDSPGFYVQPTVFADCTPDMTIFQEEVFGPVFCLTPFDTEQEAIDLANATPYGLTNYVFSRSGARRRRVARALKSGQVEMNDAGGDFGTPFGGVSASGLGREGGLYGLDEFCQIKAVTGYHDDPEDDILEDEEQEEAFQ